MSSSKSKKKRTPQQFRKICARIALIYATTPDMYNARELALAYEVSMSTIYKWLDMVVIISCVDQEIIKLMKAKAMRNSLLKGGKTAQKRSERHYNKLVAQRNNYVVPDAEAKILIEQFSKSELNKNEFCRFEKITVELFGKTIRRAIAENLVSDNTVKRLKQKSLEHHEGPKTRTFWENVLQEREENKKKLE